MGVAQTLASEFLKLLNSFLSSIHFTVEVGTFSISPFGSIMALIFSESTGKGRPRIRALTVSLFALGHLLHRIISVPTCKSDFDKEVSTLERLAEANTSLPRDLKRKNTFSRLLKILFLMMGRVSGFYKLECQDCLGVYIGQTIIRVPEHLSSWLCSSFGIGLC